MRTIRLSKSVVGADEAAAVADVILNDGYLGMGKVVQAFEQDIATFLGVPFDWVVCVNSGTAALHLAVQAVTAPGDEVLVQSLTFVASFQAIAAAGAVPVACEVVPETVTLDIDDAKTRLTPRTKAIMPVHYASNPGRLEEIYQFADSYGLRVIEDAAHAFGCRYHGRKIGSFGHIVCFSFDGIKNITSGEGGAIVTSDMAIAQKIRDARLLGVEKDTDKRYSGKRSWDFDVREQGYRYHMSNIFAAIGRVQLQRLKDEFSAKRVALAGRYRQKLEGIANLRLLEADLKEIVPHILPIRVLDGQRDGLQESLESKDIQTGIHYKPNHLLSYFGRGSGKLPITEQLYNELLSLPLHPELSEADVDYVCESVKGFLTKY